MRIAFVDETGVNPLPSGVFVTITPAVGGAAFATGYITSGGTFDVVFTDANAYVATFAGPQAPEVSADFAGDPRPGALLTLPVDGYRSPTLSTDGYADESSKLTPDGWTTLSANAAGGTRYPLLRAIGATIATEDARVQQILAAQRLQTCVGGQIDSWAADFFGAFFPRYANEPYDTYRERVIAFLQSEGVTVAAIQDMVSLFYKAIVVAPLPASTDSIALDSQGSLDNSQIDSPIVQPTKGTLAFDTRGGFDTLGGYDRGTTNVVAVPAVLVWDAMTRPDLFADYKLPADEAIFVVQIGTPPAQGTELAYDRTGGFDTRGGMDVPSNIPTPTDSAPDPRLGDLVNLVKAGGTQPLYLVFPNP